MEEGTQQLLAVLLVGGAAIWMFWRWILGLVFVATLALLAWRIFAFAWGI